MVRLFLLESLTLALCGGALGMLLSVWMTRLLIFLLPMQNSVFAMAQADTAVLWFTTGLSLASALLFGIVPAMKGSDLAPAAVLGMRGPGSGGNRWRHGMIAVEASFSVVLLCAAGLVSQNLWKGLTAPRGFDPSQVTVMQLRLPHVREQALNPTPMRAYSEYLDKLSTAGLDSAAIVYFRALRIPLRAGRVFREDDAAGRTPVAIVNQEFVRRFLPNRNPLGQRVMSGGPLTVVGVVGNVRMGGLNTVVQPQVYVSYLQGYDPNVHLVVRSALVTPELLARVKRAIRSAYADQAVFNAMTMDEVISRSVATPRFQALLIGAFAVLALVMAASGLYGVISCLVTQRASEIAIRLAFGANRSSIVRAILDPTTTWVLAGLSAGVLLSVATSAVVQRLSFSVDPIDPLMYAAIVLFYLAVTLLACVVPIRRAARLDPITALRCE